MFRYYASNIIELSDRVILTALVMLLVKGETLEQTFPLCLYQIRVSVGLVKIICWAITLITRIGFDMVETIADGMLAVHE